MATELYRSENFETLNLTVKLKIKLDKKGDINIAKNTKSYALIRFALSFNGVTNQL